MTIKDSRGHCKWLDQRRWWSSTKNYYVIFHYDNATLHNQIFKDIKR